MSDVNWIQLRSNDPVTAKSRRCAQFANMNTDIFFLGEETRSTRYPLWLHDNQLGVLGVAWRLGGNLDVWGVLVEAARVSGSRNQSPKPKPLL